MVDFCEEGGDIENPEILFKLSKNSNSDKNIIIQ